MTTQELNKLPSEEAYSAFQKCCTSKSWINAMVEMRPFLTGEAVLNRSDEVWDRSSEEDWLEAFSGHPKIGDIKSLVHKFSSSQDWASKEQAGVEGSSNTIIAKLAQGNADYHQKFGFIFIICASGLSAEQMLASLEDRLNNSIEEELQRAAFEQNEITHLRLQKLLS